MVEKPVPPFTFGEGMKQRERGRGTERRDEGGECGGEGGQERRRFQNWYTFERWLFLGG